MRFGHLIPTLLLLGACEKGTNIVPAPEAAVVDGKIHDSDGGVTASVEPNRYVGPEGDAGELVELHFEIDNHSGRALALSYPDFTLVAPDGRSWTSLDPDRLDLSSVGLRDDLLDKGVSELVFETGNEIDGYLYFQNLDLDVRRVDLHVRLRDADTGERFGELVFPMVVWPDDEPMPDRAVSDVR